MCYEQPHFSCGAACGDRISFWGAGLLLARPAGELHGLMPIPKTAYRARAGQSIGEHHCHRIHAHTVIPSTRCTVHMDFDIAPRRVSGWVHTHVSIPLKAGQERENHLVTLRYKVSVLHTCTTCSESVSLWSVHSVAANCIKSGGGATTDCGGGGGATTDCGVATATKATSTPETDKGIIF